MVKNLLLTGVPGVGKTTLLRAVAAALRGQPVRGFLTEEIREGGQKVGFGIRTLDGSTATLAHTRSRSAYRVGRYGVDVETLDRIVDAALTPDEGASTYLVDEIGKMECMSRRFVAAMERLLLGRVPVVATVALRGSGFIAEVKRRHEVELWEVTRPSRDEMPATVLHWLAARGVPTPR